MSTLDDRIDTHQRILDEQIDQFHSKANDLAIELLKAKSILLVAEAINILATECRRK